MAKLIFYYGTMGSSKTANALMTKYNYDQKNKKTILLKPQVDTRDGKTIIKSRIGLKDRCTSVEDFLKKDIKQLDVIIIDEAQFLTSKQVDEFAHIVDFLNIPVICYGLKSDYSGKLFNGSKRLFELADEFHEITTICWCGEPARFNARIQDDKVVKSSANQIMIGGDSLYTPLCRKHFKLGIYKEK